MTEKEILQAYIDHAHQRSDIERLVLSGTPSRWSRPLRRSTNRKRITVLLRDYADGKIVVVRY